MVNFSSDDSFMHFNFATDYSAKVGLAIFLTKIFGCDYYFDSSVTHTLLEPNMVANIVRAYDCCYCVMNFSFANAHGSMKDVTFKEVCREYHVVTLFLV